MGGYTCRTMFFFTDSGDKKENRRGCFGVRIDDDVLVWVRRSAWVGKW